MFITIELYYVIYYIHADFDGFHATYFVDRGAGFQYQNIFGTLQI